MHINLPNIRYDVPYVTAMHTEIFAVSTFFGYFASHSVCDLVG